uniref:TMB12sol9_3 n=1 Tax=synthetic construct TaxID=32630 RepID=UPI003704D516
QDKPGSAKAGGWTTYNTDNTFKGGSYAKYVLSPNLALKGEYEWNNSSLNSFKAGAEYVATPYLKTEVMTEYNTDNTFRVTVVTEGRYPVDPNLELFPGGWYTWNNSSLNKGAPYTRAEYKLTPDLKLLSQVVYNTDNTFKFDTGLEYKLSPNLKVKFEYGWNNSSLNEFTVQFEYDLSS